jgi:hypothetical protein
LGNQLALVCQGDGDNPTIRRYPASFDQTLLFDAIHDLGDGAHIIELVGTSDKSWEEAATLAMETSAETVRDLRGALPVY